jgi:hypothetical protein
MKTIAEKRVYDRHSFTADIAFSHFNKAHSHGAQILNLGEGGMCFKSNLRLQPGATVYIRLKKLIRMDGKPSRIYQCASRRLRRFSGKIDQRSIGSCRSTRSHQSDRIPGSARFVSLSRLDDRFDSGNSQTLGYPLSFCGAQYSQRQESPSFALMSEIFEGRSEFVYSPLRNVLAQKWNAGCAGVIPGYSSPPFNPAGHEKRYADCGPNDQEVGKPRKNHVTKQRSLSFDDRSTAQRYIDLYETILQRPVVAPEPKKAPTREEGLQQIFSHDYDLLSHQTVMAIMHWESIR